ncbi:MAG: hypothetical protein V4498_05350 [candidate division FCPU426 bacterium]
MKPNNYYAIDAMDDAGHGGKLVKKIHSVLFVLMIGVSLAQGVNLWPDSLSNDSSDKINQNEESISKIKRQEYLTKGDAEKDILKKAHLYLEACKTENSYDITIFGDVEISRKMGEAMGKAVEVLWDRIDSSKNNDEKIVSYREMITLIRASLDNDREARSQYAMVLLAKIQRDSPDSPVEVFLNDPYLNEHREVTDLNGDGEMDYVFLMGNGYCWANLIVGNINGNLKSFLIGGDWIENGCMEIAKILPIDGTKKKVAIFRAAGGQGAGFSETYFVRTVNGEFRVKSMGRVSEIRASYDHTITEIQSFEPYIYKKLYWPNIFRWNGNSMIDVTDEYPELIKKSYLEIEDPKLKQKVDDFMRKEGGKKKELWEKVIAPLK